MAPHTVFQGITAAEAAAARAELGAEGEPGLGDSPGGPPALCGCASGFLRQNCEWLS